MEIYNLVLHTQPESLNGKDNLGDTGIKGRILKRILKEQIVKKWIRFLWLRIEASGRLL
jgi:hypothetical protein